MAQQGLPSSSKTGSSPAGENADDDRRPSQRRQRVATAQGEFDTLRGSKKQGKSKQGTDDSDTIKAMAKMLCMMMQQVREINAAVFDTYMGKADLPIMQAGKAAGQKYSEAVDKWKADHSKDQAHPYGAPHLHIWTALVEAGLLVQGIDEKDRDKMQKHKEEFIGESGSTKEGLALKVGGCRIMKTYNKDTKKLLVAIQDQELRAAFCRMANVAKLQHRIGRAPTHALEKAMQRVLDRDEDME